MIFITRVWHDEYTERFDIAVVEVSDALKDSILKRFETFKTLKSQFDDLAYVVFWDCTPDYYSEYGTIEHAQEDGTTVCRLTEDERELFETEEYLVISEERKKELFPENLPEEVGPHRCEIDRLLVADDGFYWRAAPKHSDSGWVETTRLTYEVLTK